MCVCQAATGSVPVANQDATCSGKECEARPMQKQTLARIQKLSEGIKSLSKQRRCRRNGVVDICGLLHPQRYVCAEAWRGVVFQTPKGRPCAEMQGCLRKAGVGGSTPSLATTFCKHLAAVIPPGLGSNWPHNS